MPPWSTPVSPATPPPAPSSRAGATPYPPPPPETPAERKGRLGALFVMPFLIVTMMYATYMGTMHDPRPSQVPVAIVGDGPAAEQTARDLERSGDGALSVRVAADLDEVTDLVHSGDLAGAMTLPVPRGGGGSVDVITASAAGAGQASVVSGLLVPFASSQGWVVDPVDLAPLPAEDSSGTAVLFAAMGLMLAGYVPLSAMLLGTPNLTRLRRFVPCSLGWSLLMSVVTWLIVGPVIGAVDGHFLPFVAVGALAVMAVHVCQLLFTKILGPFAVLVGMLLWVIFGVPSSGLAMSIHTMPGFFGWLHDVLPLPATGQALRSIVYFDGDGIGRHLLVLAAWLAVGLALAALKERRSGPMIVGGPAYTAADAPLPALAGGPVARYRRRVAAVLLFPMAIVVSVTALMGLSMHAPDVHDMPVTVVGPAPQADQFVATAGRDLDGYVDLRVVSDVEQARERLERRDDVAAYVLPVRPGGEATLLTAAGAGASQKTVVTGMFVPIAEAAGSSLVVEETAPLTADDSNGSNSMYVGMAWILAGFLFFAVMRGGAPDLTRTRQLLPMVAGWSLGISTWLWFLFDVLIGAVDGHALELIGYGALTVFCAAWATAVLTRLLGLGAIVPVMIVLILAGVPASGGGLSLYMAPPLFHDLAGILPSPAAVDIARAVTYFDGVGVGANLAVLALWGAVGLALNLLVVDRWLNREGATPHAPLGPRHGREPAVAGADGTTAGEGDELEDPTGSPVPART